MSGGHRHGFPWARWTWYLRAHYSADGAARIAADLSRLSGQTITAHAVIAAARRYGVVCAPEHHQQRSRQNFRPRGKGKAKPTQESDRHREPIIVERGRVRRYCPHCHQFALKPKDTHCPECGAGASNKHMLVTI